MANGQKKPLMASRVALIGEEGIPRDLLDRIDDAHMQIFLREPDPREWPQPLRLLEAFLTDNERVGTIISTAMDRHGDALEQALAPGLHDVSQSLAEQLPDWPHDPDRIVDEMLGSIRRLLLRKIDSLHGPHAGVRSND